MNTLCHNLKMRLLEHEELSPEDRQHLESCADCREYQQVLSRALELRPGAAPPATLDAAVLAHARRRARSHRPRLVLYYRLAAAAAAVLLVILLVFGILRQPAEPGGKKPEIAEEAGPDKAEPDDVLIADDTEFDRETDQVAEELVVLETELFLAGLDDEFAQLVEDFL